MKKEVWLNLGCGILLAEKPFINVDKFLYFEDLVKGKARKDPAYINVRIPKDCKFVHASMTKIPFKDNSVDYVEANDSIEHLSWNEVDVALKEMYRVLKPGCKLGILTTNFDELAKLWTTTITGNLLNTQKSIDRYLWLSQAIYGNQSHGGEYHRVPFNPYSMAYRLQNAGFKLDKITIDIYPTGSPGVVKSKAFAYNKKFLEEKTRIISEMMWVEAIK